jgi:hypothetical protein
MDHFGRAAIVALVGASMILAHPPGAAACVGNMDFRSAAARTRGGIVAGRVLEAPYFTTAGTLVHLTDVSRVRGDPPMSESVWLTMGDVCDQAADPGDTIWLLYDVQDFNEPEGLAVAFVVEGSDAVPRENELVALAMPPETDAKGPMTAAADGGDETLLLLVGLLTFLVSVRPRVHRSLLRR